MSSGCESWNLILINKNSRQSKFRGVWLKFVCGTLLVYLHNSVFQFIAWVDIRLGEPKICSKTQPKSNPQGRGHHS